MVILDQHIVMEVSKLFIYSLKLLDSGWIMVENSFVWTASIVMILLLVYDGSSSEGGVF